MLATWMCTLEEHETYQCREVRGWEADVKGKDFSSTSGATRPGDVVRGATGPARCPQNGSAIAAMAETAKRLAVV